VVVVPPVRISSAPLSPFSTRASRANKPLWPPSPWTPLQNEVSAHTQPGDDAYPKAAHLDRDRDAAAHAPTLPQCKRKSVVEARSDFAEVFSIETEEDGFHREELEPLLSPLRLCPDPYSLYDAVRNSHRPTTLHFCTLPLADLLDLRLLAAEEGRIYPIWT
jgi:hypothetical protein